MIGATPPVLDLINPPDFIQEAGCVIERLTKLHAAKLASRNDFTEER